MREKPGPGRSGTHEGGQVKRTGTARRILFCLDPLPCRLSFPADGSLCFRRGRNGRPRGPELVEFFLEIGQFHCTGRRPLLALG